MDRKVPERVKGETSFRRWKKRRKTFNSEGVEQSSEGKMKNR